MTREDESFYRDLSVRASALLGVRFSPRHVKVAYLLWSGHDDERVAREVGCGRRTVQRDVASLAAMLGVRSRFAVAFELGRLWERLQRERPRESPYWRRRISE
ncbi:hypothetical protein [Phytomonospora endophytica]|uniref:DNA-binding NarL/FixJ family response regulator n=1 Tax=Phytomonospora endophytica TaxID=714109 RepID=A0A841FH53_9ACTN|nr:hypothetical protein [Phytomonospora endophytica]MBB6036651.1 DNA-binding NarL/FixJ family response regulator [Phytomonospora endophytica]GIG65972.1 hypothetical protein Pen01_22670 [Phytomonospora endophytica]